MSAIGVAMRDVRVTYGKSSALAGMTADLAPGSFTALVGPSGCGKSTTLAALAGLVKPDSGHVNFDGVTMDDIAPEARNVATVFQKPLLFPHMSVADNVGFGLRMQGMAKRKRAALVDAALASVQLEGFGLRRPSSLSGGQEQRVSLARAIAIEPGLLLLDEPFSQMDPELRAEMRELVLALHARHEMTTLFVTHDLSEAAEVADNLVILANGSVLASGPLREVFQHPPSRAVARLVGATNEISGVAVRGEFRGVGKLIIRTSCLDGPVIACIRPDALRLTNSGTLPGKVLATRFAGSHTVVEVALTDGVVVRVHAPTSTPVTPGDDVGLSAEHDAWAIFPVDAS